MHGFVVAWLQNNISYCDVIFTIKGEGNLAEFIDCSKMAKGVNIVSFKAFLHH